MTKTGETTQVRAIATPEAGAVRERPILFSAPLIPPILDGRKTQTRRIVKDEWAHGFARSESFGYRTRPLQRESGAADFVTFSEPYTEHAGEPVWFYSWGNSRWLRCPYGAPGDRLWVREAFAYSVKDPDSARNDEYTDEQYDIVYRASAGGAGEWTHYDENGHQSRISPPWKPSIHMPRWASRITLEVTGVRVERLQDITEEDAKAEGIEALDGDLDAAEICRAAKLVGGRCGPEDGRAWFAALWERINGKRAPWASNPWVWVVSFRRVETP